MLVQVQRCDMQVSDTWLRVLDTLVRGSSVYQVEGTFNATAFFAFTPINAQEVLTSA